MADEDEFTEEQWQMVREGILAPPTPKRYKDVSELSAEEHLARRHGQTEFETDAYKRARSEALLAAGLSSDEDDAAADRNNLGAESKSTDEWLAHVQERGRA